MEEFKVIEPKNKKGKLTKEQREELRAELIETEMEAHQEFDTENPLAETESEERNMQLVKYRKIDNEEVNNLVDGKFYWIDEKSEIEKEYRIFVDVYSDENKTEKLGCVEKCRFLNVSELVKREETIVEVKEKAPYYDSYYCPVCGDYVEPDSRYCPHCGSVMGWEILE